MANVSMVVWQVKEARQRVWRGELVKQVAAELGLSYGPVYNAVRGVTWSSIQSPPPVPKERIWKQRCKPRIKICSNCGRKFERGSAERCNACHAHWRRHGVERVTRYLHQHSHTRLKPDELAQLYEQYQAGVSIESLAENLPFSAETLRRRFIAAGYERRNNAGVRQRLSSSLVRQARELVYKEGVRISYIANRLGENYQTVHSAVTGQTWRDAGGPLPDSDGEKRRCRRCKLLTTHESGLCRYCR